MKELELKQLELKHKEDMEQMKKKRAQDLEELQKKTKNVDAVRSLLGQSWRVLSPLDRLLGSLEGVLVSPSLSCRPRGELSETPCTPQNST